MRCERVFERWPPLAGVDVPSYRTCVERGSEETSSALGRPGPAAPNEPWLLEDLLAVVPDPPAWADEDRRVMRVVSGAQTRGGYSPGQDPVSLLGRWLSERLSREPEGEDWFAIVRSTLDLSDGHAREVAWRSQAGSAPRLTSAGRYLLGLPVESLRVVLDASGLCQGTELSAPFLLLARHASERFALEVRRAWPKVQPYHQLLVLSTLLSTREPSCEKLAAELHGQCKLAAVAPMLARCFPDQTPPSSDRWLSVLADARRHQRLDSKTLDVFEAYVRTGDGQHLATLPRAPAGAMGTSPLDDLLPALPVPGSPLSETDRRILALLVHMQATVSLVRWCDMGALVEDDGEDSFGAARATLKSFGLGADRIRTLIALAFAPSFRNVRGVSSLGRYVLSFPDDELLDFLRQHLSAVNFMGAARFLVEEAPQRVAGLLDKLLEQPVPNQFNRRKMLLEHGLASHPELFESRAVAVATRPERLFTAEELAAPSMKSHLRWVRYDLAHALMKVDRDRYEEMARGLALAILADPSDARRVEVFQRAVRSFGGDVLPLLIETRLKGPAHEVRPAAGLLAQVFGKSAMPATEWFLQSAEPYDQWTGLQFVIGWDDRSFDDRIDQMLTQHFANKDPGVQVRAMALGAKWSYERIEDRLWGLLESKSKIVRGQAATAIGSRRKGEAYDRAAKLLGHRQAPARLGAIALLRSLADDRVGPLFEKRVDSEGSEEVRDELMLTLKELWARQGRTITWADVEQRVARTRVRDDLAPWLDMSSLPALYLTDGRALPLDAVRYLLHRQSRVRGVTADLEAEDLYALLDRSRSGDFAIAILEAFLGAGGAVSESWALTIGGILGDERIVPRLTGAVRAWIKEGRNAFAEYAVRALALQGSDAALLALDGVALRYAAKPKNVGEAAAEAFAEAAERQNTTQDELRDRVVPWLGFEPAHPRIIDCAGKPVEVIILRDFSVGLRDPKTGKAIKSLPKTASSEDAAGLKDLKEILKEAAKAQRLRLENLLVVGHRWTAPRYRERFLGHPLLRPFAQGLVWTAMLGGQSLGTFRAHEDGSLLDAGGGPFSLPDDAHVAMAHPLDLDPAHLAGWKANLEASGMPQPFPQLDRPVHRLSPDLGDMTEYCELMGREVTPEHLKRVSERLSWRRGDTSGGMVNNYWKAFPLTGLEVRIYVEGMGVSLDVSTTARLRQVVFAPVGQPVQRLRLSEVPAPVMSETLGEVRKLFNVT